MSEININARLLSNIHKMRTTVEVEDIKRAIKDRSTGIHESLLRSYQILQVVKAALAKRWSYEAIELLIDLMENGFDEKIGCLWPGLRSVKS